MTETILAAESGIQVGHHTEAHWFGLTVNTDTVLATAIAAVIVIALAFFLRAKVTSTGVPGGVQLFWEAITVQLRNQVETAIGMKIAPFVLPLAGAAATLFVLDSAGGDLEGWSTGSVILLTAALFGLPALISAWLARHRGRLEPFGWAAITLLAQVALVFWVGLVALGLGPD
jgi:hypothetical protein